MPTPLPVHLPLQRIGLVMFDDVELLDHAGPYEVFTTAQRMALRMWGDGGDAAAMPRCGFTLQCLARTADPVRARAGLRLLPDATLDDAGPLDVLIVPGGDVTQALADDALIRWLRVQAPQVPVLASVCTGAFLLNKAGALPAGCAVTTHWEDLDDLRQAAPNLQVLAERRWVMAPHGAQIVYTSAGISAGIDLSLHLVERLGGRALAERTARQMDYWWIDRPGDGDGDGEGKG